MNFLAVDQARNGAWSVFDFDTKELVGYGTFSFDSDDYSYEQTITCIGEILSAVIDAYDISVVFLEDIQLRKNAVSFKKLAQLQGVLINLCEKRKLLYWLVMPTQWQSYCRTTDQLAKEVSEQAKTKKTKALSLQYVKDRFNIVTKNDNLADAICIGSYAVDNVKYWY